MSDAPLADRLIAIPETRELDVFASMLERRGARVLRCPLIGILDAPDPAPVVRWIGRLAEGGFDDLILLTGEGLRRLHGCVQKHAAALEPAFLRELGLVRKIARGPKPGRALRELGLKPDLVAEQPTSAGIMATLAQHDLRARRVGVQLYGTEANLPLMEFLAAAGAHADPVAPYVYADTAADADVAALIGRMAAGEVDAIAFTSMQQVERLFRVGEDAGRAAELRAGLERTLVAAIGPVVAQTLSAKGVTADIVPEDQFFLKPLTQALADAFRKAAAASG